MEGNKALIIIDVQKAFDDKKWGERNNLDAEENMEKVLEQCREHQWEIIHIQHISDNPESVFYYKGKGFPIKQMVAPLEQEKVITKRVNSAFIGTHLDEYLQACHIDTIAIAGLTTPHCVSTTTRMSGNLGYKTYLLSDATAAFGMKDHHGKFIDADTIHHLSLATIHDEFASVLTAQQFIESVL
ncbi:MULTISPECIES: cysteine hydrolase family protein [Oceanobacillus]|uniref:Cysteine hydrolase family protein n=1 Tax=Oceanobacillus aidingensis TaxID=645964 RepID=A0ABV9K2J8_9BACI|nr:cysteine hydrolase family protein [Oceanobacillus oncorhynchi]MDM8101538.1 cysteine hydrolase family protein [Oceanobacillus oncorhynchi]UUI38037.1 cysteine hydrolase [Oceanobacillus oncorhynchi]